MFGTFTPYNLVFSAYSDQKLRESSTVNLRTSVLAVAFCLMPMPTFMSANHPRLTISGTVPALPNNELLTFDPLETTLETTPETTRGPSPEAL